MIIKKIREGKLAEIRKLSMLVKALEASAELRTWLINVSQIFSLFFDAFLWFLAF